jgi:peptidylprolyl isomerase
MSKLLITVAALAALALPATALAQGAVSPETPKELVERAPDEVWNRIDPENLVVMGLPSGEILIELRPDLAPRHVERIRTLTRQGFYDGTLFHRVIDGFVAQGGDPTATGTGGSDLPDVPGEFAREAWTVEDFVPIGRDDRAARIGFLGSVPVAAQPPTLTEFLAESRPALWGMHCPGVLSMARAGDPNSANSQFFIMFGDNRDSLDQRYSVWGRVVQGERNTRRINRGEPPERPTPVVRARLAADLPEDERPVVEVLDSRSETFMAYLEKTRAITDSGYIEDGCNGTVPVRVSGEVIL